MALVPLGLPGTWLVLVFAAVAEWVTEPSLFQGWTAGAALFFAAAGEVWEFSAGAVRAKRAGAGRAGSLGSLVGGVAGALIGTIAVPIPLVGSLLGGGLGAMTGAMLAEARSGVAPGKALQVGRAAAVGHMIGLAGKIILACLTWLVIAIAVWVP